MVKEFYEKLINGIIIVSLLLAVCVTVDYATNDTITNYNNNSSVLDELDDENITFVNGSYLLDENSGIAKTDGKIYTEKTVKKKKNKAPTITITSRPSCGCRHKYAWHTRTFKSYCPHCHKQGTLDNVHKWLARHEQELTCSVAKGGCGADYCGVCGKEKYSWSHYYLTKA